MNFSSISGALISVVSIFIGLWPPTVTPKAEPLMLNNDAPRRVALLFPLLSAYATIDDGLEDICCTFKTDKLNADHSLLRHIYPDVDATPLIGNNFTTIDPEMIIYFHPDAVFVFRAFAEPLKKLHIAKLYEISFDPAQRDRDSAAIWNLIGTVAKKSVRADMLLRDQITSVKNIQNIMTNVSSLPVRVLPAFMTGTGAWSIGGKNLQLNNDIQLSGGINPARDFLIQGEVNIEQLYSLDPEVILLLSTLSGSSSPRKLYDDPRWQPIRAIRERRVYVMPAYSFFNQPVDKQLILSWMMEIFHPTDMPRRTRQLYKDVYHDIYHYELSDDEIDEALFFKENSISSGYDRFVRSQKVISADPDHAAPDRP